MGAGALLLATLIAYAPCLGGAFIWDDIMFVSDNELVRQLGGLRKIWFTREAADYWPVSYTVFWAMWRACGSVTWPYHVLGVVLHVTNAFLFGLVLRELEIARGTAALTAVFFALHPVNVETAAWIFQIKTSLSAGLALLAAWGWLRADGRPTRAYVGAVAAFAAGLLAKTSIVTWPFALLIATWWRRHGRVRRADVVLLIPFFAMSLGLGLLGLGWYKYDALSGGERVRTDAGLETVLIAARAFWFYVGKALAPADLVFIYPRWTVAVGAWRDWIAPAAVILVTGLALTQWRRGRRTPFALLAYLGVTLAPVLGAVNIYFFRFSFVADHYQYLAIIAPIAVVASAIVRLPGRAAVVTAGALILVMGALTHARAGLFVDEPTIWADTLRSNPHAWLALYNSGNIAYGNAEPARALEYYRRAIIEKPDYADAIVGAGAAELALGNEPAGRVHFERALEIFPGHARALNNLAALSMNHGDLAAAASYLREAVARLPDYALGFKNLGLVHARLGDRAAARAAFRRARELRPDDAEVRANLARLGAFD